MRFCSRIAHAGAISGWLAILSAIPLLLIVAAALSVDDPWGVAFTKLKEGGLRPGLAGFLVMALVLALFRKPDAQSRASAKVK